jgi:hypothetical protein
MTAFLAFAVLLGVAAVGTAVLIGAAWIGALMFTKIRFRRDK